MQYRNLASNSSASRGMAGVPRGWSTRCRRVRPSLRLTATSAGCGANGDAVRVASTEMRPITARTPSSCTAGSEKKLMSGWPWHRVAAAMKPMDVRACQPSEGSTFDKSRMVSAVTPTCAETMSLEPNLWSCNSPRIASITLWPAEWHGYRRMVTPGSSKRQSRPRPSRAPSATTSCAGRRLHAFGRCDRRQHPVHRGVSLGNGRGSGGSVPDAGIGGRGGHTDGVGYRRFLGRANSIADAVAAPMEPHARPICGACDIRAVISQPTANAARTELPAYPFISPNAITAGNTAAVGWTCGAPAPPDSTRLSSKIQQTDQGPVDQGRVNRGCALAHADDGAPAVAPPWRAIPRASAMPSGWAAPASAAAAALSIMSAAHIGDEIRQTARMFGYLGRKTGDSSGEVGLIRLSGSHGNLSIATGPD